MPLSPEKENELNALLAEENAVNRQMASRSPAMAVQDFAAMGTPMIQGYPSPEPMLTPGGMTPEKEQELHMLIKEQEAVDAYSQQQAIGRETAAFEEETSKNPEAELGFWRRAALAVSPMAKDDKAYLAQEFGSENVIENPDTGELRLLQDGQWRPINAPGMSEADVAEVVASLTESVPAIGAAIAGGASTAGVGAIPAAMMGGAAGSAFRQGVGYMMGVPAEAGVGDRLMEVGTSAVLSGGAEKVAQVAKPAARKAMRWSIGKMPWIKKAAKGVDYSGNEVGRQIEKQAKRLKLPKPTPGQLRGGSLQRAEVQLMQNPFFGEGTRKAVDRQITEAQKNIRQIVGDYADDTVRPEHIGEMIKVVADENINSIKKASSALYDEIAEESGDLFLPDGFVRDSIDDAARGLGVVDDFGNVIEWTTAATDLDEESYSKVASVFKKIYGDLDRSSAATGGAIPYRTLDQWRRLAKSSISNDARPSDRAFAGLSDHIEDSTTEMLAQINKGAAAKHLEARRLWANYKTMDEIMSKGGDVKGLGKSTVQGLKIRSKADERILDDVFSDTRKMEALSQLVDQDTVKAAAMEFIHKTIRGKEGDLEKIAAKSLKKELTKGRRAAVFRKILSPKEYKNLVDNLDYLTRIDIEKAQQPSRTFFEKLAGFKEGVGKKVEYELLKRGMGIKKKVRIKAVQGAGALGRYGAPVGVVATGQDRKRRLSDIRND